MKGIQQPDGFQRVIDFSPAYDHRTTPGKEQYGQHCATMRVMLIGPDGAVGLAVFTGWLWSGESFPIPAMGAGVTWHSRRPVADDDLGQPCEYLDKCYGNQVAFELSDAVFQVLVRGGEDALFAELLRLYRQEWPEPEQKVL